MGVKVRTKKGKHGDLLYLDIIQNRKHHWEALGITLSKIPTERKEQLRLAEMCRAQKELQLVQRVWGFPDTIGGKILLGAYFEKVMKSKSPSTKKCYNTTRDYVLKYGDIKISQCDLQWLEGFKAFLEKEGLSSCTVKNRFVLLKGVLNCAVKEGLIIKNPCMGLKPFKVIKKEKEPLTLEEIASLKSFVSVGTDIAKENKRAFIFACYTGLRVSDLMTLTYSDIEHRAVNSGNAFPVWIKKIQVKTKNPVEIPLLEEARELLDFSVLHMPKDLVFPLCRNSGDVKVVFSEWAKKAGISKHISWHIARHSFATLASELGLEPMAIQRMLGHTSLNTTAIYAKTTDKAKSKGMEIFSSALQSVNA